MSNKPKILLTGATGFLGSYLLEALLDKGYSVVVLKRTTSDLWRIEHLSERYKCYDIDIQPIEKAFEEQHIDCVIHMATLYKKYEEPNDISEMVNVNVAYPAEILTQAVKHNVKGFINTGTFFEIDCSKQPVSEIAFPNPFNFYAKTKLAFETILQTYSKSLSINTFKLFSPFGEKDNEKLIPYIIKKALKKEPIELSEGLQKIDLIYLKDIVSAYLCSLERWEDNGFKAEFEVFNLGSGTALSIRDIVSLIETSLEYRISIKWGAKSDRDIPIAYADNSKVRDLLGWVPQYGVKNGLSNTIKYYQGKDSI